MRWFWAIWFDLDNIYLHHSRRDYLEHKFKTIKSLNGKNNFIKPLVKIPYYVWLGAQKGAELPALSSEEEDPNSAVDEKMETESLDGFEADNVSAAAPAAISHMVTKDHVHGQGLRWREPFDPALIPRFNTYIYAFAWEDPRVVKCSAI
jgi:betaine lipid synthase